MKLLDLVLGSGDSGVPTFSTLNLTFFLPGELPSDFMLDEF
jgi:hypothetical protein